MATKIKFFKVNILPGTLQSDSFYFVENGTYTESYLTNSVGVAKMIGNSTMINQLIATQLSGLSQTYIVTDIAARDILTATLNKNAVIQVIDATGDSTVTSGGATYLWDDANNISIKVAEFESMDVVLQWNNIQGKPTSTPTQIDLAVTNSHTHTNKVQLDKVGEDGDGNITYNGDPVMQWTTVNW
jgi:hypothetical protein